ncbi:MAG: 5-methylthioadenosine/S-adenosylhomocysteine deaminase [Methanohalophilus sp. T328-1]|jgi:5-methylthioadenosine/S-adenosylhomocysteine deaminase|uniref:5'-deoxyadenosine deaminase n=1 Tax=Methanohalophilus euhalobius TaxID=51203 RepID=A0A285GD76_9EURY|nr:MULTISPECIES: amidohydrolase family protein [Methanohalophilus]KXS46612.1 MAG: 5-methylthioadenosine/S-adenosylhomocysteine deaminase [Methanohalophilus sp. T328-1]RSD36122.1 MAG: 5-methylthioadenosine/S-adenosylhomocysteine deaminase [Methanohalophilus sp.]OBZ34373.1 MAG: N-ethylammeline chlorohydrolase [Methanohalophilus sp. DAL1]ODV49025.1 MAG: 5-methylthioadenosine/S-adenosylhomocysteine deaminase [Methanohalophilus sp. 2-GBenrich]RXG34045.1 5-methylthioadenosine/S-adenosylhomocysteine 
MVDILIKNGHVLTMDPDSGDLKKGEVAIENGRIVYVGLSYNGKADKIIDASGSVVMPGLVNTHNHAGMTLLRGYADDLPLAEWLEDYIWPVEEKLGPEEIYAGVRLACLEMIKSGTTTFADMYIHEQAAARAVEDCGMRAALSYGMIDFGDPQRAASSLLKGRNFVKDFNGAANGRISAMYGPHAPHTCSQQFLRDVRKQARKDGVKVHIHVLETEAELNQMKEKYGKCSVNMLHDIGFFDSDVLAAHCIWLSEGDMDILAEMGVHVSHDPVSNMKMAAGIAPVPKLLEKGVNVSLSTDGCASNNNLDMFGVMKMAALLHKVDSMDLTVIDARKVLEMATVNGAKALGIEAGMIKEGYYADLIVVDMKRPHLTPLYDIDSHLVYSALGSDVTTVLVDGKVLMENGQVLCMNEYEIMVEASKAAKKTDSQHLIDVLGLQDYSDDQ